MNGNRTSRYFTGIRNGQVMVEYLITAAGLILAVFILSVLLYAFKEQSGRVLDHVASEYP
ncbi:MAG: hypothetical protein A2340_00875 [Lentisphaerae bacterium RIFOXYB12_FULL_60_10]|nr:MAG: hypothetical protein A2269_07490 [Lentisphaerae bacterium RIFOXYA12_FULL_60_10]OGV79944.1 MAG: hypothetical protein A2340_00875 [Lentisphaerae bacterium RIFOXYB12_FULL_60_10]